MRLKQCPKCGGWVDFDDSDDRQKFVRVRYWCVEDGCNWTGVIKEDK